MTYYGKILKEKEKDNPSPFCRASYIIANVGDLVKCWGRCLRFPQLANAYKAEMKLALGDIMMQCELAGWDIGEKTGKEMSNAMDNELWKVGLHYATMDIEELIGRILEHTTPIMREMNYIENIKRNEHRFYNNDVRYYLHETITWCGKLSEVLGENQNAIRHLGFLHVCERFEQFERDGWK